MVLPLFAIVLGWMLVVIIGLFGIGSIGGFVYLLTRPIGALGPIGIIFIALVIVLILRRRR